jgi:hypothetical protein
MGTRNLTAVFVDGQTKVAQYGQWDGYPKGQGRTILNFLRSLDTLPKTARFVENVRAAKFIDEDEVDNRWKSVGAEGQWVSFDISDKFKEQFPELHRDTGGEILQLVYDREPGIELFNQLAFADDPGFFGCEWAYVVDLDSRVLEAYTDWSDIPGFVGDGRFSKLRFVGRWALDALPTEEQFLKALERQEEEQHG